MHPTTKVGQIRTLEMLRICIAGMKSTNVAIANPAQPGARRAPRILPQVLPFPYRVPSKASPRSISNWSAVSSLPTPVAVERFHRPACAPSSKISSPGNRLRLRRRRSPRPHQLTSPTCPHASFQHNVETVIWRRQSSTPPTALRRGYFKLQADRIYR